MTTNTADTPTARRFMSIALLASIAIAGAACGDNGNATNPQAFCDLAQELDQQTRFPSADQLEDLTDAAPDQIADEVELVADALVARGEPAFGEPDVEAAIAVIEGYEVKACELEGDDASEKDPQSLADLKPDPDHPYCDAEDQIDAIFDDALAAADNQRTALEDAAQRVVDEGLVDEGRTLAPENIRKDFETLASAVEAAASGDLHSITSTATERAGRRVDYFCGQTA